MEKKINVNNQPFIQEAINAVEGRAQKRCLSYTAIMSDVQDAETKLEVLGVPKSARTGCVINVRPARVANSYKGIAEGTFATITRGSKDWFLTRVWRGPCGSSSFGSSSRSTLDLSEGAKAARPSSFEI